MVRVTVMVSFRVRISTRIMVRIRFTQVPSKKLAVLDRMLILDCLLARLLLLTLLALLDRKG